MKITKRQLRRIIREEKARIAHEHILVEQSAAMPPEELIAKVEKILSLTSTVDKYLNDGVWNGKPEMVEMAFEANGDVEYHLQQLLNALKGM